MYLKLDFFLSAELQRINGTYLLCPNEKVYYKCTNYRDIYANWDIRAPKTNAYTVSLNNNVNWVGQVMSGVLGSTPVTTEVLHVNSSSIVTITTLTASIHLNRSTVRCNGATTKFIFDYIGKCKE